MLGSLKGRADAIEEKLDNATDTLRMVALAAVALFVAILLLALRHAN